MANREEREEGGTPNILGDIKLGLCLKMKQCVGSDWIEAEEKRVFNSSLLRLSKHSKVVILSRAGGGVDGDMLDRHLPIFSFLLRAGRRFLHFNFVSALLNDLFGIQTRGN